MINKLIHQSIQGYPTKQLYCCIFPIRITKLYSSYYRYNYQDQVESAINKQILSEKQAAEAYLELAVKFLHPSVTYNGVGAFFMKMYEEELSHMKQFINYQLLRGGTPVLNCNNTAIGDKVSILSAFRQSLEMEKNITKQLGELVKTADAAGDYQCTDMVSSKFLEEQMTSINELAQYVTVLERLKDNLHGMYQFDIQLGKSYSYSIK